jgi:hypothetical protein
MGLGDAARDDNSNCKYARVGDGPASLGAATSQGTSEDAPRASRSSGFRRKRAPSLPTLGKRRRGYLFLLLLRRVCDVRELS